VPAAASPPSRGSGRREGGKGGVKNRLRFSQEETWSHSWHTSSSSCHAACKTTPCEEGAGSRPPGGLRGGVHGGGQATRAGAPWHRHRSPRHPLGPPPVHTSKHGPREREAPAQLLGQGLFMAGCGSHRFWLQAPKLTKFWEMLSSVTCMGSAVSPGVWTKQRTSVTESQNHSMVGVGRDLCGSSSPTPCRSRVTYSRLQRTTSSWVFNISREGEYLQRRRGNTFAARTASHHCTQHPTAAPRVPLLHPESHRCTQHPITAPSIPLLPPASHYCTQIPIIAPSIPPPLPASHHCSQIPVAAPSIPSPHPASHCCPQHPTIAPRVPSLLPASHCCTQNPVAAPSIPSLLPASHCCPQHPTAVPSIPLLHPASHHCSQHPTAAPSIPPLLPTWSHPLPWHLPSSLDAFCPPLPCEGAGGGAETPWGSPRTQPLPPVPLSRPQHASAVPSAP